MKFALAWTAERSWLTKPAVRNLSFGILSAVLFVVARLSGEGALSSLFLVDLVLFFTRSLLSGLEIFARHGFVPGKLGDLTPRRRWNFLAPKPYIAWIGRVRFPFDAEVYSHFNPGDTLLVEHLR